LKPLLDDPVVTVRLAAAAALLTLRDSSGMPLLRQLQASEYPAIRLAAARAAASEAGPEWLGVVRELTKDSDPDVRRQAAELIAPHDPDLAKTTLEPLLADPNPAMRQAAADSYVASTKDVSVLRGYLRDPDSGTRVRAADRMLQLTR
jgi:ParB family chromosome partitioning protein